MQDLSTVTENLFSHQVCQWVNKKILIVVCRPLYVTFSYTNPIHHRVYYGTIFKYTWDKRCFDCHVPSYIYLFTRIEPYYNGAINVLYNRSVAREQYRIVGTLQRTLYINIAATPLLHTIQYCRHYRIVCVAYSAQQFRYTPK